MIPEGMERAWSNLEQEVDDYQRCIAKDGDPADITLARKYMWARSRR